MTSSLCLHGAASAAGSLPGAGRLDEKFLVVMFIKCQTVLESTHSAMLEGTMPIQEVDVEYDSVTIHYTDGRAPRSVDCVTDFTRCHHLQTGEDALRILHKRCEGEGRQGGTLVVKPLDVPLSNIDHLVLDDGQDGTVALPEDLLG